MLRQSLRVRHRERQGGQETLETKLDVPQPMRKKKLRARHGQQQRLRAMQPVKRGKQQMLRQSLRVRPEVPQTTQKKNLQTMCRKRQTCE